MIRDKSKEPVQAPAVSLSRFLKKRVDGSYETIDNQQKFLFNRRLMEAKLQVLFDLARFNDRGQFSLLTIFLARDLTDTLQRLMRYAPHETDLGCQIGSVDSLQHATVQSLRIAPRFLCENGRTQVDGNQILDLLLANAAFKLKYETDE